MKINLFRALACCACALFLQGSIDAADAAPHAATWYPHYPAGIFDDTNANRAAPARGRDWIVYEHNNGAKFGIGGGGPKDGAGFVSDGLSKAHAVYDPIHRTAFIWQGCCSWGEEAFGFAGVPPEPLPSRDLSAVHTALGVRLGMSPTDVRRRVGNAPLRRVPTSELRELSYRVTLTPPVSGSDACGESLHYLFRENRLVVISLTDAC